MDGVPTLLRERLRELREAHGLSRSALSARTVREGEGFINVSTIEAWETRPGTVPDAELLERLALAFDARPDDLFYEYPIALARRDGAAAARRSFARATSARAQPSGDTHASEPEPTDGRDDEASSH